MELELRKWWICPRFYLIYPLYMFCQQIPLVQKSYWLKPVCVNDRFLCKGHDWIFCSISVLVNSELPITLSLCFSLSLISWHFLLSQPRALLSALWDSRVSALLTEQELFHFVWLGLYRAAGGMLPFYSIVFSSLRCSCTNLLFLRCEWGSVSCQSCHQSVQPGTRRTKRYIHKHKARLSI